MCQLIEEKKYIWKEKDFVGAMCKTCNQPMIILMDHRDHVCAVELQVMELLAGKYFKLLQPRGIGMRSITNHYHEHFV